MTGRRRHPRPRLTETAVEPGPGVPGWMGIYGKRMFVVDFTAAGFPIGIREDDDPSWLDEERPDIERAGDRVVRSLDSV